MQARSRARKFHIALAHTDERLSLRQAGDIRHLLIAVGRLTDEVDL